jgi:hypothetical protein
MITGAHSIVHSTNSEADRAFLRDVLELPHVDVGDGWLIFGLPPAEVAIHPSDDSSHELYLMCENVEDFVSEMGQRAIETTPIQDQGWGLLTTLTLPGGGKLGVYQPRHARPKAPGGSAPKAARKKASKKKAAKKKAAAKPAPKAKAAKAAKKKKGAKKSKR